LIRTAAKLRIAEVFASIQGEGIWAGTPSVFVRISGCNLRCRWCDTPYASWHPEGEVWDFDKVAEEALRSGIRHVVLTGGEPMLFDGTVELAEALRRAERTITIETAGTVFRELPCDLMSISPKLANSVPDDPQLGRSHQATRIQSDALRALIGAYPCQLKFVVGDDARGDVAEVEALLEKLPPVRPESILLMPEGRDSETLHRRARLLAPICMERGWRLGPRLHIDLYGDRRGT
jgi:7-carboxy-7-deazaguanine synthase